MKAFAARSWHCRSADHGKNPRHGPAPADAALGQRGRQPAFLRRSGSPAFRHYGAASGARCGHPVRLQQGHRLSVVHVPLAWTARRQPASGEGLDRSQAEQCRLVRRSFLLTPNTKETGECAGMPVRSREEILAAGRAILEKVGCPHLLTTLGSDGMALFSGPSEVWHVPTMAQDVFDVTGAGDTVDRYSRARACRRTAPSGFLCAGELCRRARRRTGSGPLVASPVPLREAIRELPVTITKW